MAKPIKHTAISGMADSASSGILRGTLGAVAGGLAVAAIIGFGAAALVGGAGALFFGSNFAAVALGPVGLTVGAITTLFSLPVIGYGAIAGGAAGAIGGVGKTSQRVHNENIAAKNVSNGHQLELENQISEVSAQRVEQMTPMIYSQGKQDGVQLGAQMVMHELQQAELARQNVAQAEPKGKWTEQESKKNGGVDLQNASQVEKLAAKEQQAGEQAQALDMG